MQANDIMQDLMSQDPKTRLRAIYRAGIQGRTDAIELLQTTMTDDQYPELRQSAGAAIQHIQQTSQLDAVKDAQFDMNWTQQFVQFLSQSPNFSPQDIADLATEVSESAIAIVREAESAAQAEAEREASTLQAGESYEMLWDCKTCDTKGLLGVSNRYCPNCGTSQNPAWRYFPEPGQYKRLVNHEYEGVDVICPSCDTPNSGASNFCINCGTNLETGEKASVRSIDEENAHQARDLKAERFQQEQQRIAPQAATKAKPRRRGLQIGGCLAALVTVCLSVYGLFFMRVSENATVIGHEWERRYELQEYRTVREEQECPAPAGARNIDQNTATRRVPYESCEQVCVTKMVDRGDGSFRVDNDCRQECTTEYRNETYQSCTFDIDRWIDLEESREAPWAILTGTDLSPSWPNIERNNVEACSQSSDRLGTICWESRDEKYTLFLERDNGKSAECSFDNVDDWRTWQVGDEARVNFTVFSRARNVALCDEMERLN